MADDFYVEPFLGGYLGLGIGGKTKFACVDGPEFDGALVDFDEAMRRQGQYKAEEAQDKEKYGFSL